jgi:two-component system LytT family sensor kinase
MEQRLIWITLLVRLGVAAAVAGALVRSRYFKALLFREDRTLKQKIHLVLFLGTPFALGVLVRVMVKNFQAADLAFEYCLLVGVLAGRMSGVLGAVFVSIPAVVNGEWLALPFNMAAGYIAGALRVAAKDKEEIWWFSPLIDLSIYRWIRRFVRNPHVEWQPVFAFVIFALQVIHTELAKLYPGKMFVLQSDHWPLSIAIYASTVMVVAIPLKIWTSTRIEMKLEESEKLLLQARMEALQSQINPHFLFNTLNSVSSLVRVSPDTARAVILKLASILRRLLNQQQSFVQLREEVEFIDDYLDIEVVRFGEKLRVTKELDPETLESYVPSMILQPLVENAIKHGLSPKLEGGSIVIRSRVEEEKLVIEVEDDGVGMDASEASAHPDRMRIGMANVAGRLQVLYPNTAWMTVGNRMHGGTIITLHLPYLVGTSDLEPPWVDSALHEERSKILR